jgi:hypothetical protein
MKENETIWRKLPPVSVHDVENAIGRHHIQIHGIPDAKTFWANEFALANDFLTFKP